ncbi:crossover junction endonuclease MUS81-like [Mya arenaria]|uniref:crossover junction endonuclease MUS81-like n=1 Tax=Mya arenaria TaxID=6604 RepID=UPI0022E80A50|nr:crossover junction endonuclease MUS81-like [Mya arenaria]
MERHPLYGKKKKKRGTCPNPLFAQWLEEWRDSAAEKGMKSQYTYGKALKALLKFPLKLENGKECKVLENFGDKICKMLDDKLTEHIAQYGTTDPVSLPGEESIQQYSADKPDRAKPRDVNPQDKSRIKNNHARNAGGAHELSDSDVDEESQQPARKRQRSGRKSGEYVPAYRSGPYALLLTLYRDTQSPNSVGYLTKPDLIRQAQPLAEKSFTLPDHGCRYTAWSSMGTLIKKGLVVKESSPARYTLSEIGCQLAHRLEFVVDQTAGSCGADVPFRILDTIDPPAPPPVPTHTEADQFHVPRLTSEDKEQAASSHSVRLAYTYVADDGRDTILKDDAVVSIDDDIGVGFLVRCDYTQLLQSGVRYKLDTSRPQTDRSVYVYLTNEAALDTASGLTDGQLDDGYKDPKGKQKPASKTQKASRATKPKQTMPQLLPLIQMDMMAATTRPCTGTEDNVVVLDSEESSLDSLPSVSAISGAKFSKPAPKAFSVLSSMETEDGSSQGSIKSVGSTGSEMSELATPMFTLRPGQFDIILCIDNAEFYGQSKGSSKTLFPDLVKNGVQCDLRKLHVGDLLWIAREKTPQKLGELGRSAARELVLHYIVERKRMDDLVSSCIDGRYKEQKFRLKLCGLQHPMYLIEDHGSLQHFSLPENTIRQTITNTQVIDGFKVKRTKDVKETVAFLTVFTRYLQAQFRGKTLFSCPLDELKEGCVQANIEDCEQKLPVFEEFNKGSVKSKALTVREMFGKQLIQLHGMSADKARAIITAYPTPSHLFCAYEGCSTQKERDNLLATLKCGKSARNLGSLQSKQICQLYSTPSALS